jgi:hypothetical protein
MRKTWYNICTVYVHCKNELAIFLKLFSASESLVKDIPVGDGKIANLFL